MESVGVQSLTFYLVVVRIIEEISRQRMSNGRHMNTNLMGSSGFQGDGSQGEPIFLFQTGVVSDGRLSVFQVNFSENYRVFGATNGSIDGAFFGQ